MQPKITPPSLLPDPEAVGWQRNPLPPGIMSVPATTGNCPNVQQRGQISVPHALKMTLQFWVRAQVRTQMKVLSHSVPCVTAHCTFNPTTLCRAREPGWHWAQEQATVLPGHCLCARSRLSCSGTKPTAAVVAARGMDRVGLAPRTGHGSPRLHRRGWQRSGTRVLGDVW